MYIVPIWKNAAGHLLVNANGHVIICDVCPCGDDCYTDLIESIRERQPVINRTVWASGVTKTLAQCITEVNLFAQEFISGIYTGGASDVVMRTSSYATGAADFCELYERVKLLVTTKIVGSSASGTLAFLTGRGWWGENTAHHDKSFAYCRTQAEASWPMTYTFSSGNLSEVHTRQQKFGEYDTEPFYAELVVAESPLTITPRIATIDRAARVFGKIEALAEYDNYGYHSYTAGTWNVIMTNAAGTWADWSTGYYPTANPPSMPSPWCADPPTWNTATTRGWKITRSNTYALLDWDFVYV
jgi:hypothetical protein